MGLFRFPNNNAIKEATLDDTMRDMQSNVADAIVEYMEMNDDAVIHETVSVIKAAESVLRKFPKEKVEAEFLAQREKAKA